MRYHNQHMLHPARPTNTLYAWCSLSYVVLFCKSSSSCRPHSWSSALAMVFKVHTVELGYKMHSVIGITAKMYAPHSEVCPIVRVKVQQTVWHHRRWAVLKFEWFSWAARGAKENKRLATDSYKREKNEECNGERNHSSWATMFAR